MLEMMQYELKKPDDARGKKRQSFIETGQTFFDFTILDRKRYEDLNRRAIEYGDLRAEALDRGDSTGARHYSQLSANVVRELDIFLREEAPPHVIVKDMSPGTSLADIERRKKYPGERLAEELERFNSTYVNYDVTESPTSDEVDGRV